MPHQSLVVFLLAALSLIPLAGFLESAVEELAELLGEFVGGLLHTTCSNIAELAIGLSLLLSFQAADPQAQTIVLSSIAGVLLRNSLLFLGLATLLGCLRNGHMKFSAQNAGEYSTVFALAVIGLCLPTLAYYVFAPGAAGNGLSIGGHYPLGLVLSGVLLFTYLAYIFFVVFHVRTEERTAASTPRRRRRRQDDAFPTLRTQPDTQALFQQERGAALERLEGQGSAVALAEPSAANGTARGDAHGRHHQRRPRHARAQLLAEKRSVRAERGESRFLANHRVVRGWSP